MLRIYFIFLKLFTLAGKHVLGITITLYYYYHNLHGAKITILFLYGKA